MPATTTLGAIRDRVREMADIEHSEHITNDELNKKLSVGYKELVDLLVEYQIHLFETSEDITATGSTGIFNLPSDHYKTLAVEWVNGSAMDELAPLYPLKELMFAERNRYRCVGPGRAVAYRLKAAQMELTPLPASGQIYRHTYVPAPPDLANLAPEWEAATVYAVDDTVLNDDSLYVCTTGGTSAASGGPTGTSAAITDGTVVWMFTSTVDGVEVDGIAGWEEFLVVRAAILCRIKENSDYSELVMQEKALRERIAKMAPDRSEAQRIVHTRDEFDDGDFDTPNMPWPFGPRGY